MSERQLLAVAQNILRSDSGLNLEIFQRPKIGTHVVEGLHRCRLDQV